MKNSTIATLLGLAPLAACSDADPGNPSPADAAPAIAPLYAIESLVFDDQGSTSYIALVDSLGVQSRVELSRAREFPGYAPADAVGGKIVVGSGEEPVLTRYAVTDSGDWIEEARVSFAGYTSAPIEATLAVSADKAYAPFDTSNFVVWNPSTFTITSEMGATPDLPLVVDGLDARRGYGHELQGGKLYQPYYFSDAMYRKYTPVSKVSVIDTATDRVTAVVDVPCPHLHITTQDEDGNLYFSNGQGSIASAVLDPSQAPNCIGRIAAGEAELDSSFVVRFEELTDGREGSNFFYVGDGVGFFNVYHAERDGITAETPHETVDYSSSYHLWTLDLSTMEAKMMEGIDFAGGQFVAFRLGGETIVAIPSPDYASTAVYAIGPDARAEKRFDVQGWAFKVFRVR